MRSSFLAILALVALAACPPPPPVELDAGGVDSGPEVIDAGLPDAGLVEEVDAGLPDAGFGPVPVEAWCQTKAFAECARDVRCGKLEAKRLDACMNRKLEFCEQSAYSNGAARGRLQYFAAAGGACLDAYGNSPCHEVSAPAVCTGLFQGLVPPDGGCLLAEECDAKGFCQVYQQTCPFKCYPKAAMGESCNWWDHPCEDDASCEQVDAGVTGCVPKVGVGMPCANSSSLCRADLACVSKICVKRNAALGESCNEISGYPFCGYDAFCRKAPSTDGGSAGTCQKRVGLGGVCTGYGACLPNLRCTSNYQTGTCVPLGDEGATCTGYGECKTELFCWARNSSCSAYPPDGGDCTSKGSDYSCAPGFYCDFNQPNGAYVCLRKKAQGENCPYDDVCHSRACEYGPQPDGGNGLVCVEACSRRDGGF